MLHPRIADARHNAAVIRCVAEWRSAHRAYLAANPQSYPHPTIDAIKAAEARLNAAVEDAVSGLRR